MRLWKIVGTAALGLAVAVAVAAWAPGVSGQEAKSQASPKADQADKKVQRDVIVTRKDGGPTVWVGQGDQRGVVAVGDALAQMSGGSRLGVQIRDVVKDDVAKMKLPAEAGVVIDEVSDGSAASKAGLKAGDVVVQFDGEQVRSASQFARLVRETPVGRTVRMSVMRGGSRVEVTATTEAPAAQFSWSGDARLNADRLRENADRLRDEVERQNELGQRNFEFKVMPRMAPGLEDRMMWFGDGPLAMVLGRGRLGVSIQDLTPELADYFGVKDGVLVSSVEKDSPAAAAGIKAGDVITSVDGKAVDSASALVEAIGGKDGDVSIGVSRDKKPLTLKATIEKPERPRMRIMARGWAI